MNQRYLVDITSEAHQKALTYNLSYAEGIVYNDIAYMTEKYGECYADNYEFLHMKEDTYNKALSKLESLRLISVENGVATILKKTLAELENDEDPLLRMLLFATEQKLGIITKEEMIERVSQINF